MESYDLSTISRDQLYHFLSSAKKEMVKFTRCNEEVEKCKKNFEDKIRKCENDRKGYIILWLLVGIISFGMVISYNFDIGPTIFCLCVCIVLCLTVVHYRKKIQRIKKENDESQLIDLQKKADEAFDKFFVIIEPYKFPRKYWYEYALRKNFNLGSRCCIIFITIIR